MPANTARYQLPYPVIGDQVRDLDDTVRSLAARLEIVLAAAHQPPLTPSDFDNAVAAVAALNAAPAVVANPVAASAGWGISASMWAWQKVRMLYLVATNNTGAAISANVNGVLSGTPTVGTITLTAHRPLAFGVGAPMVTTHNGSMRLQGGAVQLLAYPPSLSLAAGAVVSAGFTYLVS